MRGWIGALLPAVVDASPAKQGLRMPGTDIPVVAPAQLAARRPDTVLLFLTDLLDEVRATYPDVEAAGGRWVEDARDALWLLTRSARGSGGLQQHAQPGQASSAGRPDAAHRKPQLVGDVGVGRWRVGHEQFQ